LDLALATAAAMISGSEKAAAEPEACSAKKSGSPAASAADWPIE